MLDSRKTWLLLAYAGLLAGAALWLGESQAQDVVPAEAPEDDETTFVYVGLGKDVAYLGVQLEEETEYEEGGARITEVVHESPADEAGLEVGDIIVMFDGKTIRGPAALTKQIRARKPGDQIRVEVIRDGRKQSIDLELADRSSRDGALGYTTVAPLTEFEFVSPEIEKQWQEKIERSLEHLEHLELPEVYSLGECGEDEDCGWFDFRFRYGGQPRLGVQLVEATPELKEHLGSADGTGVLVSKVMRGLPAEHAGVLVGDLIIRVGGDPIESVSDLRKALVERAGETFAIELIRDGKSLNLDVTLPESDEDEVSGPRASVLRAPTAPRVPVVRVAPPVAPAVPAPVAPPSPPEAATPPAAPAAPRDPRYVYVESDARQRAEARAAFSAARQEARRAAEVERAVLRELRAQKRETREQARALARAAERERHELVMQAELEQARRAQRAAAAALREEARRKREEMRRLRERWRAADGSV